ncbi:MAG: lipoprotein [Pseudomonadota bacterium]
MNHKLRVIILIASLFFINACGQYGDLYLPEEEQEQDVVPESELESLQEQAQEDEDAPTPE